MKTELSQHAIAFGSRRIAFTLHRGPRKCLRIIVTPNMQVQVYAPITSQDAEVFEAVRKKLPWIAKILDQIEEFHPLPTPKRYVSGETFLYLGRQYRLRIETGVRHPVKLTGKFLGLTVPAKTAQTSVKNSMDAWYRKHARDVFGRYMDKCQEVTRRHNVPSAKWDIRTMQRRWGSCGAAGRIILNTKLVQAPVHCIEYVIMHELCHLKIPNHGRAFYMLLGRCMPDWPKRKEQLARLAV